ncbi:hypothetical protein BX666DRAFT_1989930 [Dichotomocladium elegans]|nr:hypothetical protein BX666DRAFT_1989930 [Dichotomocladium elegans]
MRQLSLELLELIAERCQSTRDIAQLARVNRHCHAAALRALFNTVAIHSPRQYASLIGNMERFEHQGWLGYVRSVDLSSYSARGSGWTEAQAKAIVEPQGLAKFLSACVNMSQLYVGEEMMQAFVVPVVIRAVFTGHPRLEILDFTGFCDRKFTAAMAQVFGGSEGGDKKERLTVTGNELESPRSGTPLPENTVMPPKLSRISFFMCMALSQSSFFIPFFKQMTANGNKLERLDLANTKISSDLFRYLNPDAITHLNVQGCHGISCCSAFLPFVYRARQRLVELNMNMNFNGIAGTNFCHDCLSRLVALEMPALRILNLGGHDSMDDEVLAAFHPTTLRNIEILSLASSQHITMDGLMAILAKMPSLKYINLSRTWLTLDLNHLFALLKHAAAPERKLDGLRIFEISPGGNMSRYPGKFEGWILTHHGRRSYYSREGADPRFFYSNKLLLRDEVHASPMTRYWSYSC